MAAPVRLSHSYMAGTDSRGATVGLAGPYVTGLQPWQNGDRSTL